LGQFKGCPPPPPPLSFILFSVLESARLLSPFSPPFRIRVPFLLNSTVDDQEMGVVSFFSLSPASCTREKRPSSLGHDVLQQRFPLFKYLVCFLFPAARTWFLSVSLCRNGEIAFPLRGPRKGYRSCLFFLFFLPFDFTRATHVMVGEPFPYDSNFPS